MTNGELLGKVMTTASSRDAEFDVFYRQHFSRAVALAHAMAGRRAAEEIAQESLLAAYRRWDELEAPERWLWRVIANRSRSVLRRSYAEAKALSLLGGENASQVELAAPVEEFWAAVRALPRRQAQVVALVSVEELSASEIAEVLGCSEATVRVHLHRARKRLAEEFGAEV
jgi:RNA polymerase sigma factor (sigma-70 family)